MNIRIIALPDEAAAGLMTAAQLAEHTALRRGRVPGAVRVRQTSPDDPWYTPLPVASAAGGAR